ncbi:MAG: AbiV family abortive infection protein [Kiritimatiellia bacterium]
MIPCKKTLAKLKAEVYINAVRLFRDACSLFKARSHASAFALVILTLEELGKLEMVDHICDDISINPDSNPQEILDHLFSRQMFFNHKNKQMWASDPIFNFKKKRLTDIDEGILDRAKQDALYVGYSNRRVRSPRTITATKAYSELSVVYRRFTDIGDLGFNGFDSCSDSRSKARTRQWLAMIDKEYRSLKKPYPLKRL